jgi:hypothetical protein
VFVNGVNICLQQATRDSMTVVRGLIKHVMERHPEVANDRTFLAMVLQCEYSLDDLHLASVAYTANIDMLEREIAELRDGKEDDREFESGSSVF